MLSSLKHMQLQERSEPQTPQTPLRIEIATRTQEPSKPASGPGDFFFFVLSAPFRVVWILLQLIVSIMAWMSNIIATMAFVCLIVYVVYVVYCSYCF